MASHTLLNSRRVRLLAVIAYVLVALAVSIGKGLGKDSASDFYAFWNAGRHFYQGEPLYFPEEGVRPFIYPPFAAMLFQLLALMPFKVAAVAMSAFNILIIPVLYWLVRELVLGLSGEKRMPWLVGLLALLFSARFYLSNINLIQTNELWFLLSLAALYLIFVRRQVFVGSTLMGIASAIKLVPVFLLPWLVIRCRRRSLCGIAVALVIVVALPFVQRGLGRGVDDLRSYYDSFLGAFVAGKIDTKHTNQSLGALIYRATRPGDNSGVRYVQLEEPQAKALYRGASVSLIALFLIAALHAQGRGKRISIHEASSAYLLGHLVAGITRKAHLVTFLLFAYSMLSDRSRGKGPWGTFEVYASWVLIAGVGLTGSAIVGEAGRELLGGFSLIAWALLCLFIISVARSLWGEPGPAGPGGDNSR